MRTDDPARRLAAIVAGLDGDDRDLLFRAFAPRIAVRVRRVERDRLLAEAADRFFRNAASGSERGRQLAQASRRYAASGWRHDQRRPSCPHAPGTLNAALWRLLTAGDGRPLSAERIRKLLVTDPPSS